MGPRSSSCVFVVTAFGGPAMAFLFVACANLGELTGGGQEAGTDAGRGDAPTSAADGAAPDGLGGSEGARPDGSFCMLLSPPPTFCADFDEGPDAAAGWDFASIELGSLLVDTTAFSSPPGSLSVGTDACDASASMQPSVGLYTLFPALAGVPTTLTLDLDFRLDVVDPNSFIDIGGFQLASPADNPDPYALLFSIGFDPSGDPLGELVTFTGSGYQGGTPADTATTYPLGNVLSLHQWTHMTMALELASPASMTGNTISVSMGGATLFEQGFTLTQTSATPGIGAGIGYVQPPSGPWNVHLDNVVVRSTPSDSD